MRWTDLPGDRGRGPADEPGGWPAARLAELRQRLERLPPGHPSAPDWDEPESAGRAEPEPSDAWEPEEPAFDDVQPGELEPDELTPDELDPDAGDAAELGSGHAAAEADRGSAGSMGDRDGGGRPGGFPGDWRNWRGDLDYGGFLGRDLGDGWLLGRSTGRAGTPYRPWFIDTDWSQPWFTGDIF